MSRSSYSKTSLLVILALVFLATGNAQTSGLVPVITQPVNESQLVTLLGNTRPEATSQNDQGPVLATLHLDMYLQLKRSRGARTCGEAICRIADRPEFAELSQVDHGSGVRAAVRRGAQDIATITTWLESHGFTVNAVPANNMVIDFSGTAAGRPSGVPHPDSQFPGFREYLLCEHERSADSHGSFPGRERRGVPQQHHAALDVHAKETIHD